jgi:cytoskeletal protein RodZ
MFNGSVVGNHYFSSVYVIVDMDRDVQLKKLGAIVKAKREEKGISLRELELRSDIGRGFLSELENGKANITYLRLRKLCSGLEITLEELFKGLK